MPALPKMIALFLLVASAAPQASARELTDAPDAEMVGFSADGRYFAYEQYAWDVVSDAVYSAIFVIDRETNALVPDFPIGLVPDVVDGEFPGRVGGFQPDPALIDTGDGTPDLIGLRNAVRAEASVRLNALGIGLGGRRLAGVPITQRAPSETGSQPLAFVLAPSMGGAVPDGQHVYTIATRREPEADDCYNEMPPARVMPITFETVASATWPDRKEVARLSATYDWQVPAESCAMGIWLSDIFAPPPFAEAGPSVVVMFLTQVWQSHADSAAWHALFIDLPEAAE